MHVKRRTDAKRTQPMEGGMAKTAQPAYTGMGGKFLDSRPNRVEISSGDHLTRLSEIPSILVVEVAEKIVRTA